jgi:hypothetical protein
MSREPLREECTICIARAPEAVGHIVEHQQSGVAPGLQQVPHAGKNGGGGIAFPAEVERVGQLAQSRRAASAVSPGIQAISPPSRIRCRA